MDSQVNRSLTVAAPSGFVFGGGHVGPIVNAPQAGLGANYYFASRYISRGSWGRSFGQFDFGVEYFG